MADKKNWWVFTGDGDKKSDVSFPEAPAWRRFSQEDKQKRGIGFQVGEKEIELINAALCLRRPLLITGKPGIGKSTLAYAVAHELGLNKVLCWPITTRSTLKDGLYEYDAIGRLQEVQMHHLLKKTSGDKSYEVSKKFEVGKYITLGPLGTALQDSYKNKPRVLLIDEVDKSDIDFPNDLLHVLEEGEFTIKELKRLGKGSQEDVYLFDEGAKPKTITDGLVRCDEFPFVIMTSNGERDFPPAFLRRCIQLELDAPDEDKLKDIVRSRLALDGELEDSVKELIGRFMVSRNSAKGNIATDQLLNAVYMALNVKESNLEKGGVLIKSLWQALQSIEMTD